MFGGLKRFFWEKRVNSSWELKYKKYWYFIHQTQYKCYAIAVGKKMGEKYQWEILDPMFAHLDEAKLFAETDLKKKLIWEDTGV